MDRFTGGCLCGNVRIVASGLPYRVGLCHCLDCRKHHGALFHASAPDQLMPTYESWIVRRESWLPPFPLTRRYDRDRDATGRVEE
jgi:hypothetical protein